MRQAVKLKPIQPVEAPSNAGTARVIEFSKFKDKRVEACVPASLKNKFKAFASRVYKNNTAQFKYNASQTVSEVIGLPGTSLGAWLVELISKNKYIGVTIGGTVGNYVFGVIGFAAGWYAFNHKKYSKEGFAKFACDVGKILVRNLVVLAPTYLAYNPLAALFAAVGFASQTASLTAMLIDSVMYYILANWFNWRMLSKMNKKEEPQKELACGEKK